MKDYIRSADRATVLGGGADDDTYRGAIRGIRGAERAGVG